MGFKFKTPRPLNPDRYKRTPMRKNIAKWQWYLVALVILSPLVIFLWSMFDSYWFVTANGYIKVNKYDINAPEDAYIRSIKVIPGVQVQKGQILVELQSPILDQRLNELKIQHEQLERLQKLLKNRQKVDLIKMLGESYKYLDKMAGEYENFEQYLDEGVITLMEFRNIQQSYFQAQIQFYEIQNLISKSETSLLLENESNFAGEIRNIKAEISLLIERIKTLIIRSSDAGNIIDVFGNVSEFVTKGQTIMALTDNSPPYIKAYLNPKYLYLINKGDEVVIKFPDGKKISGTVQHQPTFSQVDDTTVNTFRDKESKVILIIKPNMEIGPKYLIYNSPVTVYLN